MRGLFLSVLMLAAICSVSGVAYAQPGLSTGLNPEGADRANQIEKNALRVAMSIRKVGIEALQNQNYPAAEKAFSDLLARVPTNSDANYLMGLAKLGRQNWGEHKPFLEIAVKEEPKRPEPKVRLGVTYVRLNDIDAAKRQRAELVKIDRKCKGACGDAAAIADGLALLDKALASQGSKADP